jgi:hypothetical protein
MQKTAHQLKSEADKIEKDVAIELESAQIDISKIELKMVSNFREQSLEEKEKLYSLFSERSKQGSHLLAKSSEEIFLGITGDMEGLIDDAMRSISCSIKEEFRSA